MRKHFLILFLMALLPLAGWAQTAEFGEMSLGEYTYGANTFPVPQVKDSEGAILNVGVHYTVDDHAFKDEACTQAIDETQTAQLAAMKADGTTKYYRKVTGKGTYVGKSKVAWFIVKKADLTLTYEANALDRTYGQNPVALDETKFTASGMVLSQTWASIKKGSMPTGYTTADNNAGNGKKVTFIGGWTADNYNIKYNVTLNISPKNISTLAEIVTEQGNVVYTGKDIVGQYVIKDGTTTLTQGTAATATAAATGDFYVTAVKDVVYSGSDAKVGWDGTNKLYKPVITFQNNYTGTISPAVGFKVTPAPITVSIDDIEVTYTGHNWKDHNFVNAQTATAASGTTPAIPAVAAAKFNYSGIVGDDVANATTIIARFTAPTTVAIATDAINASDTPYSLTITGGSANTSTNYEFKVRETGKLIIKKAELAIKANPANKNIGEANPTFTVAAPAGLVKLNANGVDYVSGVTFTTTATASSPEGAYDIVPDITNAKVLRPKDNKGNTDDVTSNYSFKVATPYAQLTVGKGGITVTIKNASKFYGQADPTFTYTVAGLQSGDQLAAFTINRDKLGAANGENVGNYALTATVANPDATKYTGVTVVPGILTINKAQLRFTIPAQNVVTGDKVNKLKKDNITVTGINNSDDAKTLYDLSFDATTGTGVTLGGTNSDEITSENKTYAGGIVATLTTAAQSNYAVITSAVGVTPVTLGVSATGKLIVNNGSTLAINLTSADADLTTIKNQAGETQTVTINFNNRNRKINATAEDTHTWAADKWNALILPFDITVAELSARLGYATTGSYNYAVVNTIKKNSAEGKFQFELATGTIKANTPFMVKTIGNITTTDATLATTITGTINFGNKKIVAPEAEKVEVVLDNGYKFVGQYKGYTLDKNMPMNAKNEGLYRFQYGDDDAKFRTFGPNSANSWTIVPFDCYVDLSADASGREVIFEFQEADGSTTAIKSLAADIVNVTAKAQGWYTINGVKLQSAPTQKGIYIFNGKKLVVK